VKPSLVLAGCAAVLLSPLLQCGATQQPSAAAVVGYGAALQNCVQIEATRGNADDCMAEVRARYCGDGGLWLDAGVCPTEGGAL
jgi:hypothetical protein